MYEWTLVKQEHHNKERSFDLLLKIFIKECFIIFILTFLIGIYGKHFMLNNLNYFLVTSRLIGSSAVHSKMLLK